MLLFTNFARSLMAVEGVPAGHQPSGILLLRISETRLPTKAISRRDTERLHQKLVQNQKEISPFYSQKWGRPHSSSC